MRRDDARLLQGFAAALREQRLHMVYQPKVSLRDGGLIRVEALVRWDDPELGPVPPSRFVPLAEEHGLIDDLTLWGLRTILRQWVDWRTEGLDTCVAFNISALSLQNLDFPDLVERMCRALDVPTERLVLELTEGATQPLIKLIDTLTRFRIKGIGLAIDDFGTGYSSLAYLKRFDIDYLKIDRSFVHNVGSDGNNQALCEAMVVLAHKLGLQVIAEGVETAEQRDFLRAIGCDFAQGFLYSQPVPPDRFELLVWPDREAGAQAEALRASSPAEQC